MRVEESSLPRVVALMGMMGAGKSTTGRLLAGRTGRNFLDSDAEVEAATGKSVAQIFAEEGEPAFRAWEARVLSDALCSAEPLVVGVAGGAVLAAENRKLLKEKATVVWLHVPLDTLITRVIDRALVRPLIADNPDTAMRALYLQREPIYREVADLVVDGTGPPETTVDLILESIA